jgi:ArsR family transcriptional regulator, lead/cadmium/zinc/bismuth-responsive transcriptional repressor
MRLRNKSTKSLHIKASAEPEMCSVDFFDAKKIKMLRKKSRSQSELYKLSEVFAILGDTTRLKVVLALIETELCVCDIAGFLGITKSAVSHHLRLMRNLRLVRFRREGKMIYYCLDDHHIENLLKQATEHIEEQK